MASDSAAEIDPTIAALAIDRSPGTITEFPLSRGLAGEPHEEENDYHAEIFEAPAAATRAIGGGVTWAASDRASPCYSHLLVDGGDNLKIDKTFDIGKPELELLIAANRYRPQGKNDVIAFGLRGCRLRGAESIEDTDRIPLEDARPDHKSFRCVIGFYFRASGRFSAFTGSTVPWHAYMASGVKNNMLPTGCYVYKKGTHAPQNKSHWVTPALRLSDADGAHSGPATVLRTTRDSVFDLADTWDHCAPSDNIHCAYSDNAFSSLGCQTVKGGMSEGLWLLFQATLKSLPDNARVDYLLFTGAECAIAAAAARAGVSVADPEVQMRLGRLRVGSEGDEVKRLQAKLGVSETGYFGSGTKKKRTEFQAARGIPADGIFSPAIDAAQSLGVFGAAVVDPPRTLATNEAPVNPPNEGSAPESPPLELAPEPPSVAAAAPPPEPAPTPAPALEATAAPAPAPAPQPEPAPAPVAQPAPEPQPAPVAQPAPAQPAGPAPAVLLTAETFKQFAPNARPEFVQALSDKGNEVLTRFGINANKLRFCHFMAQLAHESGGFRSTVENLNYRAEQMTKVFGIPASEAQRLVGKPAEFAERIYGLGTPRRAQILGNTQPGDGYRYRGRGFIQLTGRYNYTDIGKRVGLDLEGNPDLAADPVNALISAAGYWDRGKLNEFADQNNISAVTKRINTALLGLDDRKGNFAKAQRIWGKDPATRDIGKSLGPSMMGGRAKLQYGDLGPDVLEAKRLLAAAGYSDFVMDEDFSRAMHMAVVNFKMDHGLPGDGIVDAETWDALEQQKSSASRGIKPGTASEEEEERSRRRGHTIEGLGRFLFAAAAAVVAVRIVWDRGLAVPASPWEWAAFGFVAVVAISAVALMTIGAAMVREGRTRPVAPGTLDDAVLRPMSEDEQIGLSWSTRSLAPLEISLIKGKRYKGKITLTGFETWASNSMVADKFSELGFSDVDISGSGSTRFGVGKWDKPDQSVPMPSQVSDVVEVA
jgi:predicted chitinase